MAIRMTGSAQNYRVGRVSGNTYFFLGLSLASFLWDIGKQNSPRCDVAKGGIPSEAILFADLIFIEKCNKNEKSLLMSLKMKVDSSN